MSETFEELTNYKRTIKKDFKVKHSNVLSWRSMRKILITNIKGLKCISTRDYQYAKQIKKENLESKFIGKKFFDFLIIVGRKLLKISFHQYSYWKKPCVDAVLIGNLSFTIHSMR
jgi:hypothetical protein